MQPWHINEIPAFCITLGRRVDRWKRFQDQPGSRELPHIKRFLGVDGKTLNIKDDERVALATKRNVLAKVRRSHEELDSVGGVGCALSHIAIWEWLAASEHDKVMVFEDDAVVPAGFVRNANAIISSSPVLCGSSWDLLLLGGSWADVKPIQGEDKVQYISGFFGLYGYVITKKGAQALLKEVYPIHCHIDIWITLYKGIHGFNIVGSRAFGISHQDLKTEIQSDKECRICNISNDFETSHVLVDKGRWYMAQTAEVLLIGIVGYYAWRQLFGR
jgi:glycosyl transferase family 25